MAKPGPEMNRPVMGTWFLITGIALLVYDGLNDWDTIWATAVGLKLLVVAVIFLVWEPLRRLDERERARRERLDHEGHEDAQDRKPDNRVTE